MAKQFFRRHTPTARIQLANCSSMCSNVCESGIGVCSKLDHCRVHGMHMKWFHFPTTVTECSQIYAYCVWSTLAKIWIGESSLAQGLLSQVWLEVCLIKSGSRFAYSQVWLKLDRALIVTPLIVSFAVPRHWSAHRRSGKLHYASRNRPSLQRKTIHRRSGTPKNLSQHGYGVYMPIYIYIPKDP